MPMNYELRTNKGFTLIELVVAIALLSMVLGFSSVIFKTSIEAHRTAGANSEIMQKLRAITDQLNRDFKGIQKDAPMAIWFQQDANVAEPSRYDQIMFFANGDFQSTRLYNYTILPAIPSDTGVPISGNVARIYYGQATVNRDITVNFVPPWLEDDEEKRILGRRQHILTADPDLDSWPDPTMLNFGEVGVEEYLKNESYEHDSLSLSQWKTIDRPNFENPIIPVCFWVRPQINTDDPRTFHKLMCDGVSSFAIQMHPDPNGVWQWWPEYPDFPPGQPMRCYFNVVGGTDFGIWRYVSTANYPKALKFTFTLYDSKGIIRNGGTFTHIVYLE